MRFDTSSDVEGYEPEKYRKIYDAMPGKTPDEKISTIRKRLSGKKALTVDQLSLIVDIEETPSTFFKTTTPDKLKRALEDTGFTVIPLGGGKLKGIEYQNGGGYRVLYGGDGYIQYHPEKRSHHGGAYYKTACGRYGKRWYNLNGDRI